MALTVQQKAQLAQKIMQDLSLTHEGLAVLRSDVTAAIDAVDLWVENNQVSYNNALPTAAKNNLTAGQKSRFLAEVLTKRFGG